MRFLSFVMVVFLSLGNVLWAADINGEFIPAENQHLKEGDIFEATMRFWPIESADLSVFKKMDKTTFFNAFYLAHINSVAPSSNNADVVEVKGTFIVQTNQPQPIHSFKYKDSLIEMHLDNLKIAALAEKNKDYFVLDQSLTIKSIWMSVLGALAVVLMVAFLFKNKLKSLLLRLKPNEEAKAKERYGQLFRSAHSREEFETIYKEKNAWLPLLKEKTPAHMDFFKVINSHQFKRFWSNEDLAEVRSSFDVIRRSFEK